MSQIFSGVLGALAVSLTLGAAQFASGSDLGGAQQAASANAEINRSNKADRAGVSAAVLKTQTISVSITGLADTSVLVRIPVAQANPTEARNSPSSAGMSKQPIARTVACEPVVSILTEVSRQLQPGRCVT